MKVSVVIPVLNGSRYLDEVLTQVQAQEVEAEVELLVIDSGSNDDSVAVAKTAGANVIEISPDEFGHGKTRNLAFERSEGEYVALLTQDATPASRHWLASLVEGFRTTSQVGLVFGPHLPRPDTSPMIARELEAHFGRFSSDERPAVQGSGDDSFFSNVNSCISRACWQEVRFRDVLYAEDQAFARDALATGWRKVYVPVAGVLHAHDYPWRTFMRRYFDEYRGLRATIDHREPFGLARTARQTQRLVRDDLRYMRARGLTRVKRLKWAPRSAAHHAGRATFSALGSRSGRLPGWLERRLSLEGTVERQRG